MASSSARLSVPEATPLLAMSWLITSCTSIATRSPVQSPVSNRGMYSRVPEANSGKLVAGAVAEPLREAMALRILVKLSTSCWGSDAVK